MRRARSFIGTAALVLFVSGFALSGCADKPSKKSCEQLLDHVIKIEAAESGTQGKMPKEMKKDAKKAADQIREEISEKFMKQCMNETSPSTIKCGMEAKTRAALAECNKS